VQQHTEADRREVDPPIQVEAATWSSTGRLDWWVKSASSGWVGCGAKTVVNVGFELLIFVPRAAHRDDAIGDMRRPPIEVHQ